MEETTNVALGLVAPLGLGAACLAAPTALGLAAALGLGLAIAEAGARGFGAPLALLGAFVVVLAFTVLTVAVRVIVFAACGEG